MSLSRIRFACAFALLSAVTGRAVAVDITDNCVGDSDWSYHMVYQTSDITTIVEPGTCSMNVSFQVPFANQWARVCLRKNDLQWNASVDGAISTLTLQINTKTVLPYGERVYLSVFQNGKFFTAISKYVHTGNNSLWHTITIGPCTANDFAWENGSLSGNASVHPDFGAGGGPLLFAFTVGNPGQGMMMTQSYANLHVTVPGPVIALAPQPLDFGAAETQKSFEVWNGGVGTLNYEIQTADLPDWVSSVSPTSGSSVDSNDKKTHTVTIDRCKLAAGQNLASLPITCANASNSPQTLTCSASGGTISGVISFRDLANNPVPNLLVPDAVTISIWKDESDAYQWPGQEPPLDTWLVVNPGGADFQYCVPTDGLTDDDYTIGFSVHGADQKMRRVHVENGTAAGVDVWLTLENVVRWEWWTLPIKGGSGIHVYIEKTQFTPEEAAAIERAWRSWSATGFLSFSSVSSSLLADIRFYKRKSYHDLGRNALSSPLWPCPPGSWPCSSLVPWDVDFAVQDVWSSGNELLYVEPVWVAADNELLIESLALHEIGHVLGLKYPYGLGAEGSFPDCQGGQWSAMSYNCCGDNGFTVWPGWSDVQALRLLNIWSLVVTSGSPVDISLSDWQGNTVSKQLNQIPGASYVEADLDGDGEMEDQIFVPSPTTGTYSISVIPEGGADPNAPVTLTLEDHGVKQILLDQVYVADLPTGPMPVLVDRTPPVLIVQVAPTALDPCDGRMVSIHVDLQVQDETDPNPQVALAAIAGAWPAEPNDIADADIGTDDCDFELRAACDGICGQSYTIVYAAVDATGNQTIVSTTVSLADDLSGSFADCNSNGIADECELKRGTSPDCNTDSIPDECQLDSDDDGLIDACDPCPYRRFGDMNGDGLFDINDLAAFIATLLDPDTAGSDARCAADLNGEGQTNGMDIQSFLDELVSR